MSTSDNEKCENKLPKIKTKIVNKRHTEGILKYYIKEKKVIIEYLKKKIEKEERKIQVIIEYLKEKLEKEEKKVIIKYLKKKK